MASAKCSSFIQSVTVEPAIFLFSFAYAITSVVEQDFYVRRSCLTDLQYPMEVCANLTGNKDEHAKVQVYVSSFMQWNEAATWIFPICFSLFVGAWSDRHGRKHLLLLGLFGKIWWSAWAVAIAAQQQWSVMTIAWLSSLLSGLTGADVAIATASCSYICDITTEQERTARLTILDVCSLIATPVGIALGNLIFHPIFNGSHVGMFALNTSMLILAFVYAYARLDWETSPEQRPLPPFCKSVEREKSCLPDFFNKRYLVESVGMFTKARPGHGRLILALLTTSLALYMFIKDDKQTYLYTLLTFHWDVDAFSNFRTFQSSIYVVGTLIFLPIMTNRLKLFDTTIMMAGAVSHILCRLLFASARETWLFYLGCALSCIGPVTAPAIRSMVSKITPACERGKVFAVLSVADTCMPILTSIVYTQIYNATIASWPASFFAVAAATQACLLFFAAIIRMLQGDHYSDFTRANT